MESAANSKIVPLVDVAIANRDRLIERERGLHGAEALRMKRRIARVDRWLSDVAYPHVAGDYWTR